MLNLRKLYLKENLNNSNNSTLFLDNKFLTNNEDDINKSKNMENELNDNLEEENIKLISPLGY